eukprot:163752_1
MATSDHNLNTFMDFLHAIKKQSIGEKIVRRNMLIGAISWIPIYSFFHKLYYPYLYKTFNIRNPKIAINKTKMSGIATNHFCSLLHAIYVSYSVNKSWKHNKYKTIDIKNACDFNLPKDLMPSVNITLSYFIIDLFQILYFEPKKIENICHHILSIAWCCALKELNIGGPGYIFIGFYGELSTIFMHPAWFIKQITHKFNTSHMDKHANRAGLLFAIAFLYCRIYKFLLSSPDVINSVYNYKNEKRVPKIAKAFIIFSILSMDCIGLIWTLTVIKLIKRFVLGKKIIIKRKL